MAAAIASESQGRRMLAWAAVAGGSTILALKSKETALVLLPVLAIILAGTAARVPRVLLGVAAGGSLTILILWLSGYERRLRSGEQEDEVVDRFLRVMSSARYVTIWFFAVLVLFGIWAASQDSRCIPDLG